MKKRRILGLLLTLGMILGMSLVANAASVSSVTVKQIDQNIIANWNNDDNNLTIGDLPEFQMSTLEEARAWSGSPDITKTVYLIYDFDGQYFKYTIFSKRSYIGQGSGQKQHKLIYQDISNGEKYFYTTYTHHSSFRVGDVIKVGDTIEQHEKLFAYEQYTTDNSGAAIATANGLTLIQVGKYYCFKKTENGELRRP